MKKYGILVLLLFFLAGGFLYTKTPLAEPPVQGNGVAPEYLLQIMPADARHERTITWQASAGAIEGVLELRQGGSAAEKFLAAPECLPEKEKNRRIYTVHLTGLQPGTFYEYRSVSAGQATAWHGFKTEAEGAGSFKALIFGDSQCADYTVWGRTSQAAWLKHPDAAFFINMGDLVDNGESFDQWKSWMDAASPLLDAIPVAPVQGNHEAYSLDWKKALPKNYLALFAVPKNGPAGLEKYAYSYDYGPVHFAVLNTQQEELGNWLPDLLERQKKWLEADLAGSMKPWKIVLMHRGIWKFPPDGRLDAVGDAFVPIFDRCHVDVVFTAHVHAYARTKPLRGGNRVQENGTVYITTGRSGDKVWERSPQKPWDEVFHNPLNQANYLVLEAAADKLTVMAWQENGELLDQFALVKN
jgi:Predicted phosphohydrolases